MNIKANSMVYKKDNKNYYIDAGLGPMTFHAFDGEPENFQQVLDYVQLNPNLVQQYPMQDNENIERIRSIKSRLIEIDRLSIRALRTKTVGKDNQADRDYLATLDNEAEILRGQL